MHKNAYDDAISTEDAFGRLLYGSRVGHGAAEDVERRLGHALLHLPSNLDSAMQQFRDLGWTDLALEKAHYTRWSQWRTANALLWFGDRSLKEYFIETIPEGANNKEYWDAYDSFERMSCNQMVITTVMGRFGWAPDNHYGSRDQQTRSGDPLCVIFGCSTPLMIRATGGHYKVIGEAYIQGLMEGEVLRVVEKGEVEAVYDTFC